MVKIFNRLELTIITHLTQYSTQIDSCHMKIRYLHLLQSLSSFRMCPIHHDYLAYRYYRSGAHYQAGTELDAVQMLRDTPGKCCHQAEDAGSL